MLSPRVVQDVRRLIGPDADIPDGFEAMYNRVKEMSDRFLGPQYLNHEVMALMVVLCDHCGLTEQPLAEPDPTAVEPEEDIVVEDEIVEPEVEEFPEGIRVSATFGGEERFGTILGPGPKKGTYRVDIEGDSGRYRLIGEKDLRAEG